MTDISFVMQLQNPVGKDTKNKLWFKLTIHQDHGRLAENRGKCLLRELSELTDRLHCNS